MCIKSVKFRNYHISEMKNPRRNQVLLLSFVICIIFISLFVYIAYTVPEFNQYRLVRSYQGPAKLKGPRTILLWNKFFGDKRWSLPGDTLGPDDFRNELHCPVYQCELSNNHNFLPSVDMYDAIVFHTAEPFPLLDSVPSQRVSNQFYVFALMESPGETKHILNDEVNFYNLTMTYRLDSDIVWPYKYIQDIETGAIVAPTKYPAWRKAPTSWNNTETWKIWRRKTNDVAWFVSHCNTLSKREELVKALQRHISVDIFGKCGPNSCQRSFAACDELLDNKYKFYLSFENSLCIDYVSEKLFNAMKRSIIPVVFGGANYDRFVPPRSYINAENFESVEGLAVYLKYLADNPSEYMSYFWWRGYYRLMDRSPFCDLCEKLHNPNYLNKIQTYHDIENWWLSGSCRFKTDIKL